MADSSGATVFDDLPEWLIVDEILSRLPAKDVLRCRAVRKSWRSTTSTDTFILQHHRHQPSLPIIEHLNGICRLDRVSNDQKILPVLQYAGRSPITGDDLMHRAVCDGLIILAQKPDYYICNPATRKCASLPLPPLQPGFSNDEIVGFYRHQPSGEYRMLWASYSTHIRVELPDYFVLTVGSVQPRRIQWQAVSEKGFPTMSARDCPPVHHRGSLHWAVGLNITVFDPVAETFRHMSRPAQLGDMVSLLDTAGGALALCRTDRTYVTFDVWVLQDYDAETWGFQYHINLSAMVASPPLDLRIKYVPRMAVINEHELVIGYPDRLLHCNIDGVFVANLESEEHGNYLMLTRHRLQESMISLPLFEKQEEDAVNKEPPFLMVL
ncbi:F-box protein At5g49610-like [Triticum dicoccoides]|uniref:F-box protein At5g49610-like n=1 Tax=Triticum dicoccoides TaxID=85692 RepID=UPI000E7B61EC|nr:F-box protein At5g49610-like [Triticum dicoccoides]